MTYVSRRSYRDVPYLLVHACALRMTYVSRRSYRDVPYLLVHACALRMTYVSRRSYRDVPRTIVANSGDFSNNIYTSSSIAASISSRFDWINGNPTECARFMR